MKKTTLFLVLLVVFSAILVAGCTQQQPVTPKEKVVTAVNQTVANLTDKVDQTVADVTNKTEQTVANLTNKTEQKIANLTTKVEQKVVNLTNTT